MLMDLVKAGRQEALSINSPMTVGAMAGQWCPHGLDPDLPGDQRAEVGGSLVFDFDTLDIRLMSLGHQAGGIGEGYERQARCESRGSSLGGARGWRRDRVSYGLLNLTHRDSHESPEPLEPGKAYEVEIQLCEVGHRFTPGNKIRVALSTSYWPIAWPAPEKPTITLTSGNWRANAARQIGMLGRCRIA